MTDTRSRRHLNPSQGSRPWDVSSERVVVIDNGAGHIKAGFIENTSPSVLLPCSVRHPAPPRQQPLADRAAQLHEPCLSKVRGSTTLRSAQPPLLKHLQSSSQAAAVESAGPECQSQAHTCCPMSGGMVTHWDDMTCVWDRTFYDELQVDPASCKVLLTQSALNPAANRRRTLEKLLEHYGFAAASLQAQPLLALYAQGCVSGLVVDAGHSITSVVAVVEGAAFPNVTKHLQVAGKHVTQHLMELMQRKGYGLSLATGLHSVSHMKETLCYVALDPRRELKLARETTYVNRSYTLPDGATLRMSCERFQAAEALFDPSRLDIEGPGIAQAAFDAIQQMDMDNRRCLYEHVVLVGGTTMFPGLPTRMEREIQNLFLEKILRGDVAGLPRLRLKVSAPPNRRHLAWVGGAVLADLMKDQPEFWITKQDYEEDPHRALNKCC